MAQEWFFLLAFINLAALSKAASNQQLNKTITDGKVLITGDHNEIVITNNIVKESVPSDIHEKLDSLRERDEALSKKVKELEERISTLGEIQGKLSLMNKTVVELNKKIEELDHKINKPALFRTVLPSISQVNKTLEGGKVLLIQNHNQVVVSGDGKITAELSEMRKMLDSLSKLGLELDQKVKALDQKVTQMTSTDYALRFPKVGTSDYVIIRGMPSLNAMTICFWMMTADPRSEAAPFSYAAHSNTNEILFINHKNFRLAIANEERTTSVSANDGKWHHICATWENTAGSWKFYKDGMMKASGHSFKAGHVIQGGGVLTLGQDQDAVGGNFQAIQSFVGELTGVNIWNHVIAKEEISRMSQSCLSGEGNVFKWSDFKAHVQGDVRVIASPSCTT